MRRHRVIEGDDAIYTVPDPVLVSKQVVVGGKSDSVSWQ